MCREPTSASPWSHRIAPTRNPASGAIIALYRNDAVVDGRPDVFPAGACDAEGGSALRGGAGAGAGVEQDPSRAPAHHFQATVMQCKALYTRDDDHSSFQLLRFAARTGGGSWEESSAG